MTVEIYALTGENRRTPNKYITSPTSNRTLPYVAEIGHPGGEFDVPIPGVSVPMTIACGPDAGSEHPLNCTASCEGILPKEFFELSSHEILSIRARVTRYEPDAATLFFASAGVPVGLEELTEVVLCRIPPQT